MNKVKDGNQNIAKAILKIRQDNKLNYIFEYPLSIIFMLALLFVGLGIYSILKEKKAV